MQMPFRTFSLAIVSALSLAGPTTAQTPVGSRPTIVLVHGAFADSSSWNGVISSLVKDGYPVVAAAVPLRGVASDAAYVSSIVKSISGPVMLVGHSYPARSSPPPGMATPTSKDWCTSRVSPPIRVKARST